MRGTAPMIGSSPKYDCGGGGGSPLVCASSGKAARLPQSLLANIPHLDFLADQPKPASTHAAHDVKASKRLPLEATATNNDSPSGSTRRHATIDGPRVTQQTRRDRKLPLC